MTEQREWPRFRSLLKGSIRFDDPKLPPVECVVRDLSRGGARISVPETALVASRFTLVIPQKGQSLQARFCWRKGTAVGVAFDESSDLSVRAVDPHERIRQLEEELTHLRERLAEMKTKQRRAKTETDASDQIELRRA